MRINGYYKWLLMLSAAMAFAGCSKDGGDDTQQPGGSSIKTSAKVQFVSRLTDASLFSSSSDADEVDGFVNTALNDNGTVVLLDRTDKSGVSYVADMIVASRKWSGFVSLGQNGTDDFDVSTIVFNNPSDRISGYQILSGSYVSGLSVDISGTVTNLDAEGNVTNTNNVTVSVPFYSCRFETEDQINAFGGASGVMNVMKSVSREFVVIGTVKNDLMQALQSAVTSADSGYTAAEVFKGSEYSIFMLYATRYWGFNGVSESEITGGITAYAVDISWK